MGIHDIRDIREKARARARRAYEGAQLRVGLVTAAPLIVLVPAAALLHQSPLPQALGPISLALAAMLVIAGWRGGGWRRGALVGLAAGLPGLLLPRLVLAPLGHCPVCDPLAMPAATCFLACGGAGLVAGVIVGALAARDASPVRFALAAAATACATAALTCVVAGLAGLTGVACGIAVSVAPTALVRARLGAAT